jgi:hypothetical protein
MALVVGLALPVAGQLTSGETTGVSTNHPTQDAKLPYTAEYQIHSVRQVNNGESIGDTTELYAVDAQGRKMTSLKTDSMMIPMLDGKMVNFASSVYGPDVNVTDPANGTISLWRAPGKMVTVTDTREFSAALSACAVASLSVKTPAASAPTNAMSSIELGTKMIGSFEAWGTLITTTRPAGMIGNPEPEVSTLEIWRSTTPGLNDLVVYQVSNDPKFGKTTRELVNLIQGEPDPTLFQPPADYLVVNKRLPSSPCPTAGLVATPHHPDAPPPSAQ